MAIAAHLPLPACANGAASPSASPQKSCNPCEVRSPCRCFFRQAPPLAFLVPSSATYNWFATTSSRTPNAKVLEENGKQNKSKWRVLSSKAPVYSAKRGSQGSDDLSEEIAQPPQTPEEKDRFFRAALVTGYVVKALRPLLERLGLVIVRPRWLAKASFAISKQRALADGVQGNSILCLPVNVRVGQFWKNRGYTGFTSLGRNSGFLVLVEADVGLEPVMWDSPVAVYLFTGRSIPVSSIALTARSRSRYAPHRLGTYEDLASVVVEFAKLILVDDQEGPMEDGRAMVFSRATISVKDLLPLPTLEQMTIPTSGAHKRAMEAYVAFFGAEGLLASSVMHTLLKAEREEGSRSGLFMLVCKLKSGAVQLRAAGRKATAQPGGCTLCSTWNDKGHKGGGREAMLVGEVDITVVYTPCLGGCYLIPEFALAQRGVRKISGKSSGKVGLSLSPYGGGRERTRAWNMFLVDCSRPEEWVYAHCHAILALAAEGKAEGWEAMPPMEELALTPVTLPAPAARAKNVPRLESLQQDRGS